MFTSVPRVIRGFSKAQYLVSVAATLMLAGCSQSFDRFAQNPSNSDPVYTASVPKEQAASASPSEEIITSKPLAHSRIRTPGGGYNYSSNYRPPVYKAPHQPPAEVASVEKPAAAPSAGSVTVGPGMTLYSIAKSNNLTVAQLAHANSLTPPYSVRKGMVLRIPVSGTAMAAPTSHKAVVTTAEAAPPVVHSHAAATASHDVARGDTLYSLGRKYGVSPFAIADANGLKHNGALKLGQSLKIPAGGNAAVALNAKTKPVTNKAAETTVAAGSGEPVAGKPAKPGSAKAPAVAEEIPATKPAAGKQAAAATEVADAGQADSGTDVTVTPPADVAAAGMRWPVRGKVISGFGAKPNGLKNEGINIAVPEGTSIRAADSGVVAYAGNELKGYGNLVLIRHDGGLVTAYAHAKELFVKRGDTVKRGDVIAKAGQTGSVSSPQLHFEVRKGATALDPITYLSSATAAN